MTLCRSSTFERFITLLRSTVSASRSVLSWEIKSETNANTMCWETVKPT